MAFKLTPEQAKMVDEAGALDDSLNREDEAHIAKTAERRARLESLRVAIAAWNPKLADDAALSLSGKNWTAVLSERGNRSKILDMTKVIARLGMDEAKKWISIPLGELRKLLPKHEHADFMVTERTGPRSLEFVPKAKEVKAA